MRINLISRRNGVGLSRDADILTELLISAGHQVDFTDFDSVPKNRYDLNIFLELVSAKWFYHARMSCIVPNPEWYEISWRPFFRRFRLVLAKTRCAQHIFTKYRVPTAYTSFTSVDRYVPTIEKDDTQFFHLAGRSLQKQTNLVIETWLRHPELPHLTVVQDACRRKDISAPNLTLIYDHLPDEELKALQNKCGFHLCPSETEGFGHYIMEGLSCRAIVVTTNAPPMNEMVTEERGVLCQHTRQTLQRLAINYYTNEENIVDAVNRALALKTEEKTSMRDNARKFYEENDRYFREAFVKAISSLKP
jgi:glycosyltransferase involved in cell wall biosynthesis